MTFYEYLCPEKIVTTIRVFSSNMAIKNKTATLPAAVKLRARRFPADIII